MSTLQVVELHICMHRKTANIHMEKRSVMLTIMAIRLTFNIRLPCDKSLRRLNEIFFQCRSSQCGVCGHSQRAQSEAAALPEFSHHRCPDARNHIPGHFHHSTGHPLHRAPTRPLQLLCALGSKHSPASRWRQCPVFALGLVSAIKWSFIHSFMICSPKSNKVISNYVKINYGRNT